MTVEEIHQLIRLLIKEGEGDSVKMQKAMMSLPKDQRKALTDYVLTVEGFPWKEIK